MSPAADRELRVWLQLFNVKYQIHLSNSGFGRQEEPLVPPCDGCCIYDLFSASAEIVLVHYAVTVALSMTRALYLLTCTSKTTSSVLAVVSRQTAGEVLPGRPDRGGEHLRIIVGFPVLWQPSC